MLKHFDPSLRDEVVYLNAASRTPMPLCVAKKGVEVLFEKKLPWNLGKSSLEAAPDMIRRQFLELVIPAIGNSQNTDISAVAITPSTSFAVTAAAKNLVGKVKKVIVLQDQMSSNVLPWQTLPGAEIEAIARPCDGDWTPKILQAMRPGISTVVAIPHCHWCDGAAIDLHQISKACSDYDQVLFVDATQSLGATPLEIHGPLLRLDFLCASTHKWLFGPYGASPLYVDTLRYPNLEPLVYDEHALAGADDNTSLPFDLTQGGYTFQNRKPGARPLDGGGRPNPIILPMVAEGLRFLLQDLGGPSAIQDYIQPLSSRCLEHLQHSPQFWTYPRYRFHHIFGLRPAQFSSSARPDAVHCADFLKQHRNLHITGRFGALRVAFHVYNCLEDVDTLFSGLESWRQFNDATPSQVSCFQMLLQ